MSLILWREISIHIFLIIIQHTHTSFSVILAGILRAGKKHFLGNLAVRFVCRMRSTFPDRRIAHALSVSLYFFAGNADGLYHILIFYVNQTDSVLNFARGQTPADDTCVY